MGSKSNAWSTALLNLIFNNVAAPNIGNAGGLLPSSLAGNLYVSLHTADPGVGGSQTTSEATYTGYARQPVARAAGAGGWTITGQSVSPSTLISFPIGTAGGETCTFAAVGTVIGPGAGEVLYRCALTPSIVTGLDITPQIPTTSVITES